MNEWVLMSAGTSSDGHRRLTERQPAEEHYAPIISSEAPESRIGARRSFEAIERTILLSFSPTN